MDYRNIYNELIEKRKQHPAKLDNDYTETHHIVPRSIDPSLEFDKNNLVSLTAREHFIAHLLLIMIYKNEGSNEAYYKMLWAFNLMCNMNKKRPEYANFNFNSRLYESIRTKAAELQSKFAIEFWKDEEHKKHILGSNNGMANKQWIHNPLTNENKTILKEDSIPEGWIKGRKNFFTENNYYKLIKVLENINKRILLCGLEKRISLNIDRLVLMKKFQKAGKEVLL